MPLIPTSCCASFVHRERDLTLGFALWTSSSLSLLNPNMAPEPFKFQKGPICLSDDEEQPDLVNRRIKLSKFDIFTTILHFLSVYISTAGAASLVWAYTVVQGYNRPWPAFRQDFVENFVAVIVLVS